MTDTLADCWVYYGQEELADLVAEVGEATKAIDKALERQGLAIEALSNAWQAFEAKRMAEFESFVSAAPTSLEPAVST
jgi:hypothetical protein